MTPSVPKKKNCSGSTKNVPQPLLRQIHEAIMAETQLPRSDPTKSQWQLPPHPTLSTIQSSNLPLYTDFVVIGSGITGCSVTKTLLETDKSRDVERPHVTVLEARTLVSGATGRNGGHLVSPAGHSYLDLVQRFGEENAKQMARFSIMNIDRVLTMVRQMDSKLQESSEIRDVRKIMVAGDKETWERAIASLEAFRDAIPEHRSYHNVVDKQGLEEWNVKDGFGGIEHGAGAVWPYRLITGIFERLLQRHPNQLAIETNTPVTEIRLRETASIADELSRYPYAVTTPRGTVLAGKIIHCTNAYASHLLPNLRGNVYPYRGTMSVQVPGPNLKNVGGSRSWSRMTQMSLDPQSTILHTGLVYLQQNAKTGEVWAGTETSKITDILTTDDTYVTEEARHALQEFLPSYFREGWASHEKAEIRALWTGIMGYTSDGLPLVGRLPECITNRPGGKGEWIAGVYNGYGMDKAWMTGEALVKMIRGEDVPAWFPQCFLISEKRFLENMSPDRILEKFASLVSHDAQSRESRL